MDATIEYLWAAGYDLPPDTKKTILPLVTPRRGKKAARAKRKAKCHDLG
jgi:hypothetical protein